MAEEKMFCFQCQETAKNKGCTFKGMCGKESTTANLQDVLIYTLKGIAFLINQGWEAEINLYTPETGEFIAKSLFKTITNANFDDQVFLTEIIKAGQLRDTLKEQFLEQWQIAKGSPFAEKQPVAVMLPLQTKEQILEYQDSSKYGVLRTEDTDIRSLRELTVYGLKGMAAYADHAHVLGAQTEEIYQFIIKALAKTLDDSLSTEELISLVLETGKQGVKAMEILDEANTSTYGHPEITKVDLSTRKNPGILITGHDLKDLEELLLQTEGTGVDVYTHGEMLPAQAYPFFKKFSHFAGNYGNSWWLQNKEFIPFNGPILFTTNCITPPRAEYLNKIFTTGNAGYSGCPHIKERTANEPKDFSAIIELAQKCPAPEPLEEGTITTGFAHHQVMAVADQVIAAVKKGSIKRFIVMAGCDGRHPTRNYYTEVAKNLPADTIILTAGCAKFRYNKLDLGEIEGIPRLLDAGQCNDSYSLVYIAKQLQKAFALEDINDLPISYDIAWYEQKAVIVLLALLSLGIKGIRLGPTLPGFLSTGVKEVLVKNFSLKIISEPTEDIVAMLQGN